MKIEQKTTNYSEQQKSTVITYLRKKYNFSVIRDYGSNVILENFTGSLRAEILIGGNELQYTVFSISSIIAD
jgi:DNA-directed RNA polymerase subunit E'/Rpb7